MNFDWIIRKQADIQKIKELSSQTKNLHPILTNLLISRNIDTKQKIHDFFKPKLENLHDPFLLKDMKNAIDRLEEAIKYNEKILVYGDYDVDGTTAVALVYTYLKKLTNNIDYYVPDRYTEGYGISFKGIDFAAENEFSLIIALDCGIKAVDKIDYASKKNIDFIICDHHTPGEQLPKAKAVLNPKRSDCQYPFKELTGCGVGFKLIQALSLHYTTISPNELYSLLDFVAISIASDIVPVNGENRILAYFGLKELAQTKKPGLIALKKVAQIDNFSDISISDVVFRIGPRINAAGRIEHASHSVNLLIEQNQQNADEMAQKLNEYNSERKNEQDNITNEILEMFKTDISLSEKKSTVVYNENWNKGVVGIVASKIIEHYYKPTIILTKSENKWTGSARSVENFDLYDAIEQCSHLLTNYGGHKFAAGITLNEENLQKFVNSFENIVANRITSEHFAPKLQIAGILDFVDITEKFVDIVELFAPFGPENLTPVFLTTGVVDTGFSVQMGKNYEHLRLFIQDKFGNKMQAIAFNFGHYFEIIKTKKPFDICYSVQNQIYNGQKNIQLNIKDFRFY